MGNLYCCKKIRQKREEHGIVIGLTQEILTPQDLHRFRKRLRALRSVGQGYLTLSSIRLI